MNKYYETPVITLSILLPISFLTAFYILGSAINWPDSLNGTAAEYLPMVAAHADEVRIGYSFYFAACALHAIIALMLTVYLGAGRRPWLVAAAFIGVAAGIFKMLGIARWLEAMPMLATNLQVDPVAGALAYELLNDYAGVTLGEGLGVGLFAGLWYAVVALASGSKDDSDDVALPVWLRCLFGVTALTSLWGFAGLYGVGSPDGLGMLNGYLQYFSFWFLAAALLWARRQRSAGTVSAGVKGAAEAH